MTPENQELGDIVTQLGKALQSGMAVELRELEVVIDSLLAHYYKHPDRPWVQKSFSGPRISVSGSVK